MSLGLDTSKAARSRQGRLALVTAVRDALATEQETNWLEWKGSLDLAARATEANIAKAVIGFANRAPDIAARAMEGCAYLLVGAEPGGSLSGVVPIDQAKLEAGVAVYVGQYVDWDAAYVELDGKSVLVVTVEPPRWGDPIRCFRKAYLPAEKGKELMPAATIFVRHTASTERATPDDIDMLSRRAARQPGSELDIEVRPVEGAELGRADCRPETIEAFAADEEQRLLRQLTRGQAGGAATNALFSVVDHRSPVDFRQQVARYIEQLKHRLRGVLLATSVLHNVGLLELEILNRTDATFIAVQVELTFPAPVGVCVWKRDATDRSALPDRPAPYGEGAQQMSSSLIAGLLRTPTPRPGRLPHVKRDPDCSKVVFKPVDVRAGGGRPLDDIWLLLNQDAPPAIELK
jgi:hypothetical protein